MNKIRKSNIDMLSVTHKNLNNESLTKITDSKCKSKLRESSKDNNINIHFCSCNKDYLPLK